LLKNEQRLSAFQIYQHCSERDQYGCWGKICV